MSPAAAIAFGLFIVGVAGGLAQLWLQIWSPDTFMKLAIAIVKAAVACHNGMATFADAGVAGKDE